MKLPVDAEIRPDELEAGLRWIHAAASPSERALVLADARERLAQCEPARKSAQTPLAACWRGERMAGSYFKLLSGNVATLGGARAAPGWEQVATDLIISQIELLSSLGVPQIQAIVRADDLATNDLVRRAGMTLLTKIDHLWLDVLATYSLAGNASGEAASVRGAGKLTGTSPAQTAMRWRPAHDLAQADLAQFIDATFADTLDCPALNGHRTPVEVLDGFLEGRELDDSSLHWELLEVDASTVGCLLLQVHENQLMELMYMGLIPAARGRSLGKAMVARAIDTAHRWECSTLVVAVDRDNWPALDAYLAWGFQPHQRLQVWLAQNNDQRGST